MTERSPKRGDVKQQLLKDPFTTQTLVHTSSSTPKNPSPGVRLQEQLEHHGSDRNQSGVEDEDDDSEQSDEDDQEEGHDEDEEDDEPKLKYARLTQHIGGIYRNGDATSTFLVSGDKMIVGTHNGNIHVTQLPNFQSIRGYHAHSASVTAISASPCLHPTPRPGANNPSNSIYVATSSVDGNICVQSLSDPKDVQLRNFARPLQAVALSPDYKNDRAYLSGGRAGQLVLTADGPQGRSTSTTVGSAAAAAAGWLGSMGLGQNIGKDTILHSGEGAISAIKWSLSGKYVVWLNEQGIKIMRSNLQLENADVADAWKRIGHIDRPQNDEWEEMAEMWQGRVEWIDEAAVEANDPKYAVAEQQASAAAISLKQTVEKSRKSVERLLVGWGGTLWIIHVHAGRQGTGKKVGAGSGGRAEIVKILRMDCIISGISLYTPSLLLVLAYCLPDNEEEEEDNSKRAGKRPAKGQQAKPPTGLRASKSPGGIRKQMNSQTPELRLIDLVSQIEVDRDNLNVSRFERLSSHDYHLNTSFIPDKAISVASSSALETLAGLGTDVLNAALYPKSLFSSGASVKSRDSNEVQSIKRSSTIGSVQAVVQPPKPTHPSLVKPGLKIFIHSPYDCILATKRDLGDHLIWLMEHYQYQQAWELVENHPEIIGTLEKPNTIVPPTPDKKGSATDDSFDDTSSVLETASRLAASALDREKRRIGELWIQQLVESRDWASAGRVCGKVLGSSDRWEKWVWTFATSKHYDEITPYIPADATKPLPRTIYEVVLGHYLKVDKLRFKALLEQWSLDLYDINTIITALENQLKFRDVREDSIEQGERGRDWRVVVVGLARLYEANGRHRESLKSYIKLQDADSAFRLIREYHLADAVVDDIPSFISLRVPDEKLAEMTQEDIEEATSEAIALLVDEAQHGLVKPSIVVEQLQNKDLNTYIFLYLRALWLGAGTATHSKSETAERLVEEGRILAEEFSDLVVTLFAQYDRPLLMEFLRASTSYTFEKAAQECETHSYIPELVYLYSKTGQMKRALFLIIERLRDVSQAIAFAKEQNDPDLWDDLLNYSMDKPRFIRGLLEEVGTAINPIKLIRRIPEGLEIEGLRDGIRGIIREHEIQWSILEGTSRVLRSEVAGLQRRLRAGQRRGIKFEVAVHGEKHVGLEATDGPAQQQTEKCESGVAKDKHEEEEEEYFWKPNLVDHGHSLSKGKEPFWPGDRSGQLGNSRPSPRPGHCSVCHIAFQLVEVGTMVGFACGHVFHLQHLVQTSDPEDYIEEEQGEDAAQLGVAGTATSVGSKVMHARLLRDRMGGCPVCRCEGDMEGHEGLP